MSPTNRGAVSVPRVPVSTTGSVLANHETRVPALIGTNSHRMHRLVHVLVHSYGWILGQDGNLYAPDASMAWGERVA